MLVEARLRSPTILAEGPGVLRAIPWPTAAPDGFYSDDAAELGVTADELAAWFRAGYVPLV